MAPAAPDSKARAGACLAAHTEPLGWRGWTGLLTEPAGGEDTYGGGRVEFPAPERQNSSPRMTEVKVYGPLENGPPKKGNLGGKPQLFLTALPQPTEKWCSLEGPPGQGHQVWGSFCSVVSTEREFSTHPPTTH